MRALNAIRKACLRNRCLALCLCGLGAFGGEASVAAMLVPPAAAVTAAEAVATYRNLPMTFEVNQGQADRRIRFIARSPEYGLYLSPTEVLLTFHASTSDGKVPTIRMRLAGANPNTKMSGLEPRTQTSNYDPT